MWKCQSLAGPTPPIRDKRCVARCTWQGLSVKAQVPLVVPRCTKLPRRRQLLSAQQGFTLLLFPVLRCTTLYRDPGKQKVLLKHPSLSGFPVLPQRCPGLTPSPLSSADFPVSDSVLKQQSCCAERVSDPSLLGPPVWPGFSPLLPSRVELRCP